MKLLDKSLGVLRAELHKRAFVTISGVSAELQRRAVQNARVRAILESNPQWRAAAGPVQRRILGHHVDRCQRVFAGVVAEALY